MEGMDELLQEVAELPCANTPLWAAHQMGALDHKPQHPAEGEVLCFSECHACRARVRAIELLKTYRSEAQSARRNAVYGAVVAQISLGELARQQLTGLGVSGISSEQMSEFTATAREIADAALQVDP